MHAIATPQLLSSISLPPSRLPLPNDLLPVIALHLAHSYDYQSLRSLQLVSRFGWTSATPHLYDHATLATDKAWLSLFHAALQSSGGPPQADRQLDQRQQADPTRSRTDDPSSEARDGRGRLRYASSHIHKLEIRGLPPVGFDDALAIARAVITQTPTSQAGDRILLLPHTTDVLLSLGEFPYEDLYTGSRDTQKRLDTLARLFDTDGLVSPTRLCIQGGYRCHHYRLTIQRMTRRWKDLREVIFHDTHINIVDQLYIPGVDNRLYLDPRQMASFSADTKDRIKDAIECHAGREVTRGSSWRLYGNPEPEDGDFPEKLAVSLARGFTSSSLAFLSTILGKEGNGSKHVEETLKNWTGDGAKWVYTDREQGQAPPCPVCHREWSAAPDA